MPARRTAVLYARLDEQIVEWVRGQSDASGMSMAQVTGWLLWWCREAGVQVGIPVASTPQAPS